MLIEREPDLKEAHVFSTRRLNAIHSLPIPGPDGETAGTISLLTADERLAAERVGPVRARSPTRRRMRSSAPASSPTSTNWRHGSSAACSPTACRAAEGVQLAGHYLAGGDAVEVGGDWYDAVRRADGIIQLCVGDVSGKGIGAATVMGRQRNVFHVYAHDYVSPAEIIRRMLRHAGEEEMITLPASASTHTPASSCTRARVTHRLWWSTGARAR